MLRNLELLMDFRNNYNFDDFTIENYSELVRIASENFIFTTHDKLLPSQRYIIWRHDIEFSPEIAARMSLIEKSFNVETSYFINLHSEFYNVFQKDTHQYISEILKNGHHLGLHFDCHFHGILSESELDVHINKEKIIIEDLFDIRINTFSFHNLNSQIKGFESETYGGLINVYNSFFKKYIDYCTDSTGYWRYERLENKLKDPSVIALQVLIHDGMWQDHVLPPRKRVFKVIDDWGNKLKAYYDRTLKEFGANNIDWDEII